MKTNGMNFFKNFFKKEVKQKPLVIKKEITVEQLDEKKKLGKGRAFQNRKTTRGRRSQYVEIGRDSMGNMHHKLICHSF